MIGSVNQLEAQLRNMPDEALAQVAQANQDNALVMAAVLNEKSRRDRMRGGIAGMQAAAQVDKPTVRDQLLSGIAAASVDQSDMLADGGIVSFAGGGAPEEDYSDEAVRKKLAELKERQDEDERRSQQRRIKIDRTTMDDTAASRAKLLQYLSDPTPDPIPPDESESEAEVRPFVRDPIVGVPLSPESSTPTKPMANRAMPPIESTTRRWPIPPAQKAEKITPPLPATKSISSSKPKKDSSSSTASQPVLALPQVGAKGRTSPKPESLSQMVQRLTRERNEKEQARAQERRAAFEQAVDRSTPYKGLEELYKRQEEKDAGRRDRNLYESLLSAGLGMMSGTSPYALKNIAEGGAEGLAGYKTTAKELDAAEAQRGLGIAQIEEGRRQQEALNQQRAFEFESGIRDADSAREDQGLALAVNARLSEETIAAQLKAAGMRASAAGGAEGQTIKYLFTAKKTYQSQLTTELTDLAKLKRDPVTSMSEDGRAQIDNAERRIADLRRQIATIDMQLAPYGLAATISEGAGTGQPEVTLEEIKKRAAENSRAALKQAPVAPATTPSGSGSPVTPTFGVDFSVP